MYNYREAVKNDVMDYMENKLSDKFTSVDELRDKLNDDLWVDDSVTGNGSGQYTFNSYEAGEYVRDNMDLVHEMASEFGVSSEEIGNRFMDEDWEWFDVSIRCYLLSEAIDEAIEDIGEKFIEEEDVTE